MRRSAALLLFLTLICFSLSEQINAQQAVTGLQPGSAIERTIGRGQVHRFSISLGKDQFLQLVVDQRGIDVVVRVFSPEGKSLGEFDAPNGNEGPEDVSLISSVAGTYFVDVTPLSPGEEVIPGRYEIRIIELRQATDQELQAGKRMEALRIRGLELITALVGTLPELHLPQARVRAQVQAAQLLWTTDEKLARRLLTDAMAGVRDLMTTIDSADRDYYQSYGMAMELRQQVLQAVGSYDPELALEFLHSTGTLVNPDASQVNGRADQDRQFKLTLASQIAAKDPKRTFEIAKETLKTGYSSGLIETIHSLVNADPELATTLTKEIAAKLQQEKLTNNAEAASLAVNLLRFAHARGRRDQRPDSKDAQPDPILLSEQEYRDLFAKTLADGLAITPSPTGFYSVDVNAARTILGSLRSMTVELGNLAPDSIAAIEKKTTELNAPPDPRNRLWQKYQDSINNGTAEAALQAVEQAPAELKDQLYQQLSAKFAGAGDLTGARQIVMDHILNPMQRQQALNNLEQQAIYGAMSKGKVEEALRSIGNLRTARERANILGQIVDQIGPGKKKATALNLLDQARSLLGSSAQAEDQEQMNALLQLSLAFARYDSRRAFEVLDPLLDQFNEISAAAVALNGFGQQYYQDGELIMQNGNAVANTANQLILALGRLSVTDFDRAKADAERLQRPEVRIGALLAIAEQTITMQQMETRTIYRRVSQ
jgi:hypothetical protein